ncbi:MAG: hypothetical protein IID46_00895 [Planctomycetes bacterium]|nr:hypothetical protein [Planctomycetota bacterium]
MEALRKTYQQYLSFVKSMTSSQRATLAVVMILVIGGLGYLVYNGTSSRYVTASFGKSFSAEEQKSAEQALREQGLGDFKFDGDKLLVPKRDVDRYNAALVQGGGMPNDWASELEKQYEKNSWFSSDRQSQARKDIALAKELRRVIRAIPDIADASVVWARSKPKRFSGKAPKVTATVNVQPKRGHELEMHLVHSLRAAVASMVADLSPEDVTIFDMNAGKAYTSDRKGAFDNRLLTWIKQFTQMHKTKIEKQLSYIPDVLVTVDVQVENLEEYIEQGTKYDPKGSVALSETTQNLKDEQVNQPQRSEPGDPSMRPLSLASSDSNKTRNVTESNTSSEYATSVTRTFKKYIAAMPKAVTVSVAIPEEYFKKAAEKLKAAGGNGQAGASRQQILADIKKKVTHTIGADANSDAVDVQPYIRVDRDVPELETDWMEVIMSSLNRWGSVVVLGLFAVWALWMVKKNMPQLAKSAEQPAAIAALQQPEEEPEVEVKQPAQPSSRDKLQTSVRDNPEMAASVLSQWLKTAVD